MKTFKRLSAFFLGLILCVVLAACGEKENAKTPLDDAATYVFQMYKDNTTTVADYELVDQVKVGEDTFTITWTKTIKDGGDANAVTIGTADKHMVPVTITINKVTPVKTEYTLTGTIADAKGKTKAINIECNVPKYELNTWAEWNEAKSGDELTVRGVITAKGAYSASYKNIGVWLQDTNGGYFAYRLKCDSAEKEASELAIGNTIDVIGKASPYNNWKEMGAGCTYEVVSTTKATVDYKDITEDMSDKTKDVSKYQNMKVTFTGIVRSINDADKYGQAGFTVDVGDRNVTIYCKFGENGPLTEADHDTIMDSVKFGYAVTIKGIMVWYKTDPQIHPTSAADVTVTSTTISDDYKAIAALDSVTGGIKSAYFTAASQTIKLTTSTTKGDYNGATYVWTVTEGATVASVTGGTLTLTAPEAKTDFKLKCVATFNEKTAEKIIASSVTKMTTTTEISKVTKDGSIYMIEGRIVAKDGSNRPYIQDATGVILAYNNSSSIKDVAVGSTVKIIGDLAYYNGLAQFGYNIFEVVSTTANDAAINYGTAETMTAAAFVKAVLTDKEADMNGKYVKVTGLTATISGNYVNAYYMDGETKVSVQLQLNAVVKNATDATLLAEGVNISVYGYSYGCNSTQARITVTSVEAAS